MNYVVLVILLAMAEYIVLVALVGRARAKYGVRAPATSGNPVFERTFRVQQNTLEGLVILLPGLWLFGQYLSPGWAVGLGIAGIVGIVNITLVVGALVGVIRSLL